MNILGTIGKTPLVELKRYEINKKVRIYAKLEGENPGGSIKDRVAVYLIQDGENRGILKKGKTIIEATSGNTGIGLAMVSAIKGYKFTAVMSEGVSEERKKILKQYGAELILTDKNGGTNLALETAERIVENNPEKYIMLNQYKNKAAIQAHYEGTGKEIVSDMRNITYFVAGMGTGGTLMGVGKRLKQYNKNVKIIGIEPNPNSKIQGLRNMEAYRPPIFQYKNLDLVLRIEDEDAFTLAKDIYQKEGISIGISSGAALWGAIQISKTVKSGNIVTIFSDKGDRYVSTELFN